MGVNIATAVAGVADTAYTSGFSLFGTATAIAKGYKDYSEYREKLRENPSFLLWQIKK